MLVRVVSSFAAIGTLLSFLVLAGAQEPQRPTAAGPVFSTTGPDAAAYGVAEGYPLGTKAAIDEGRHLVAVYSRFDDLFTSGIVIRAKETWSFRRAPTEPQI